MASIAATRRSLAHLARVGAREIWLPVLVLVIWYLLTAGGTSFYFPPLGEVLQRFSELWIFDRVPADVVPSLVNLMAGLGISVLIAIPLGLFLGLSRSVYAVLDPVLSFAWALPKLALLPAFVAIAGIGVPMKVSFIVAGTVWPILLGTIDGVRAVDPTLKDLMRSYHLSRRHVLFNVYLPAAGPQIFAGIRTALSIGLVLVIVGEMLVSSNGLGFFVLQAQQSYSMLDMWAGALVVGLLGYLLNLIFTLVERRVLSWHFARRALQAA